MNHEVERYVGELTELRQHHQQFVNISSFDHWYDSVDTQLWSDYEHNVDRSQMIKVWLERAFAAGQLNSLYEDQGRD